MPGLVIVPSGGDFTCLSRTRQGQLFRKHILTKGELIHPNTGEKITVDDAFVDTLRANFAAKVCPIVQVPLANDRNEHTEAPDRNIGEVVDLVEEDGKVYAHIDVRDADAAPKMGKTLLGASAMMHLDYKDTKTDEKVGPTLLHVCVTNRPYVTDLDDFEEIVAATSDYSGDAALFTNQKETAMTLEELLKALADDHGIDVQALQTEAERGQALTAALTSKLQESGILSLSGGQGEEILEEDMIGAVVELADKNSTLATRVASLEKLHTATEVDQLVKDGKIIPAKRDDMLELALTNRGMFDRLIPETPIVAMNHEAGAGEQDKGPELDVDKEIARLSDSFAAMNTPKKA